MLAAVRDPFAAQTHLDHVEGLPEPLERPVEAHPVQPFHDLRTAHPEPEHEPAPGEEIEAPRGHRGHGGRAGGDLHDAGAEPDPRRDGREVGDGRHRVLPPCLRRPREVHPEALRLAHVLDHFRPVLAGRARAAERDGGLHGPASPTRPPRSNRPPVLTGSTIRRTGAPPPRHRPSGSAPPGPSALTAPLRRAGGPPPPSCGGRGANRRGRGHPPASSAGAGRGPGPPGRRGRRRR